MGQGVDDFSKQGSWNRPIARTAQPDLGEMEGKMVTDGDEELAGTFCSSRPSGKRDVGGEAAREGAAGKQGPRREPGFH